MSKFGDWLSITENRKGIPDTQIQFILRELDSNKIAIRGSDQFPITYSLLVTVS